MTQWHTRHFFVFTTFRRHLSSSWEFLQIEKEEMETVQNNFYGEKLWETTYFCEEEMEQ